jgi:hypothetical protein
MYIQHTVCWIIFNTTDGTLVLRPFMVVKSSLVQLVFLSFTPLTIRFYSIDHPHSWISVLIAIKLIDLINSACTHVKKNCMMNLSIGYKLRRSFVSLSTLFHLCLFSLSFFSHAKHSISSHLVKVAHRPWTKLSVNSFTISLDFFELFLRDHTKTVFMNQHVVCTTPLLELWLALLTT